jgi:choline dehydrogenase-like flavoprotein
VTVVAGFTPGEAETLAALFDTVIPPDADPGGWEGGVERLLREHLDGFLAWSREPLRRAAREADTRSRHAKGFAALSPSQRRAVVEEWSREQDAAPSDEAAAWLPGMDASQSSPLSTLLIVAFQGYYGGTDEPAGWSVAGFRAVPPDVATVDPDPAAGIALEDVDPHYDVVVIGAGAGGGVAAAELAESGRRVLLVERSRPHRNSELRGNHLQGKRLALYDVTVGPGAGNPRVLEHPDGTTTLLPGEGDAGAYGLVAMTLGGGTRVWQGMSWRFFPEDFRMASEYGVPPDSTLADWPFGYDELAPYYDRVEWELGVSGDGQGPLGERTPRARPYPMTAMPADRTRILLGASAAELGWATTSIPFAINSVPRGGRTACVRCSQCIGHACPVDAKNGTHNTFIPRAIRSGNADLLMRSQVVRITHDEGRARGVVLVCETPNGPRERFVRADRVVLAAGALETPRLLLASGLGNEWVGRNHQSHGISIAVAGESPADAKSDLGPGHSVATLDFVHRDHEAWGGGVLFDLIPAYPLGRALAVSGSGPRHGPAHKDAMRRGEVPLGAMSMVQEIPHRSARVSLDPVQRDRYGMPVVRAAGTPHAATVEAVEYMNARAVEWVEASGGRRISTIGIPGAPQGAEHSAGTTRMGADPRSAACDPQGRLFGTSNVYVADASLHPTNGGFNPALTAMANALRVARLLHESWGD